ncbi:MAG: hypothetical protein ACODAU_07830 [Myxococcota bacterium]
MARVGSCAVVVALVSILAPPWGAHAQGPAETAGSAADGDAVPALRPEGCRLNPPGAEVAVRFRAEVGALGVVEHRIRYGADGTRVDYRRDADQDTLFLFWRLSGELQIRRRHTLVFLYQPLDLRTESVLGRDLLLGEVRFAAGTPMRFGYGFDFYRLAYQFDLLEDARREVAFGAGFQIRNARVGFFSQDGTEGFSQTNVGVVPLLRFRGRYTFERPVFLEVELDGLFTPTPAGRGPDDQISLGAILDASLRAGLIVTPSAEVFLNLRYLGGGFRGESGDAAGLAEDDTWSSNWLHTVTVSLGFGLR